MAETLADLGEWELIRRLGAFAPPGQFCDDAALLAAAEPVPGAPGRHGGGGGWVLNTDLLVEGVHFSEATTGPEDVGWRAAAANLSDLAAMGCTQVEGITVGLVAPATTSWAWVEGVYRGLQQALEACGGVLLGGDCSGGAQRLLAVTALGRLPLPPAEQDGAPDGRGTARQGAAAAATGGGPWGAIRRGDGQPGDALLCSGPHGLSRLGLALLQGELPQHPGRLMDQAIRAHQRPRPRFDAVRALRRSQPQGLPWRVGGCDSSDGLAAAVAAIASASGCGVRLERSALPLDPAMADLPEAEAWCLGGGEDFELVLALDPAWAEALVAALPAATVIGRLEAAPAGKLTWSDGGPWPAGSGSGGGFRHFG